MNELNTRSSSIEYYSIEFLGVLWKKWKFPNRNGEFCYIMKMMNRITHTQIAYCPE